MSDNSIAYVPYTFDATNWVFLTDEQMSNLNLTGETDWSSFGVPNVEVEPLLDLSVEAKKYL